MPSNPQIEGQIPNQNFELARNAIGSIIKLELLNQKDIGTFTEDPKTFLERTTPIQASEKVVINVQLSGIDYSDKNVKDGKGFTTFHIDVYTTGKESADYSGDEDSTFRLHKFIGIIRYILQFSGYKTLSLPLGIVAGTSVDSFQIMNTSMESASSFVKYGRITFTARIMESQQTEATLELLESETGITLDETDLGYELVETDLTT